MTDKNAEILEAAMKARIAVMLVGSPGTGKTAHIRSIADKMGYELITLIGSQMDPTDVVGLPKAEKVGEREDGSPIFSTVYLPPYWQTEIMTKKKVILFIDEYSNTPPATRSSLLTPLQNREFPNGDKMPDETIVIGAMNPPEEAADGFELDLPTKNRLFFFAWNPTMDSWFEGMLDNWGQPCSDEEMEWRRKIVAFIKDNPDQLHKQPVIGGTPEAYGVMQNDASEMNVASSAWASRRSWDNLAKVLGKVENNDVYVQDTLSKGIVGVEGSFAFREWLMVNDFITPQEAIDNPKKVDWASLDLNDTNLLFRGVTELVNDANGVKIIHMMDEVLKADKGNLLAPYIKPIMDGINKNMSAVEKRKVKEEFKKLLPRLHKFISNN